MKKLLFLAALLSAGLCGQAQEEPKIKLTGYLETYYSYDFNRPADHNRPAYIYSHSRSGELNLNLGFIKAGYDSGLIRANMALMAGTYTNANLAAEQGVLKNVFEANAGLKILQSENLWIDAGVFASHIGFESAISKDCWVLTRNIASDNTPYYESGVKATYVTKDGKLTAALLYLNGWQRISREDGNDKAAGGLQLTWKPNAHITVNYSNYLGTEGADSLGVNRVYHNLYGIFQLNNKIGLTLGLDYGTQQEEKGSKHRNDVISPVIITQYKFAEKWALAGRFEYYQDKSGIFIATGTPEGFQTKSYSLNLDYSPLPNAVVRLEGKAYDSKDKVFSRQGVSVNGGAAITGSFAVSF